MNPDYPVQHLVDYATRYAALLLRRFQKPRMAGSPAGQGGVFGAVIAEVQALEDMLYALLTQVNLDAGIGAQLDLIGAILAVPRYGLSDDAYRLRLRVEILVLRSNGRPDDTCAILTAALPTGCVYTYGEADYCTAVPLVTGSGLDDATALAIEGFLQRARAMGCRVLLEYNNAPDANVFLFSPDLTMPVDSLHGLGDCNDPSVGGFLDSVLD